MKLKLLGLSLAIGLLLLSPVNSTFAQPTIDPAQEQEALWVFGQVLSPFCPGKLLQDCPSSAASELKTEIREKIKSGKSREDVLADLYLVYGDEISAVPRTVGFGLLAWLAPLFFVLFGLLVAYAWLLSKRKKTSLNSLSTDARPPLSEEQRSKISSLLNE
jgi:cytochrome c-type biogenesis protein CcmH